MIVTLFRSMILSVCVSDKAKLRVGVGLSTELKPVR